MIIHGIIIQSHPHPSSLDWFLVIRKSSIHKSIIHDLESGSRPLTTHIAPPAPDVAPAFSKLCHSSVILALTLYIDLRY